MVKNEAAPKKIVEKTRTERRAAAATPDEGARLIRAFIAVKNPQLRRAIVAIVENLG